MKMLAREEIQNTVFDAVWCMAVSVDMWTRESLRTLKGEVLLRLYSINELSPPTVV